MQLMIYRNRQMFCRNSIQRRCKSEKLNLSYLSAAKTNYDTVSDLQTAKCE